MLNDLQTKNLEYDRELHDFSKVEIGEKSQLVNTPSTFNGDLKSY